LLDGALALASRGVTTLKEVERVIGDPAEARKSEAERASEPPSPKASAPASDSEVRTASSGPPHVLLIDDDPVHRAMASRLLSQQGFQVDEAASGTAAIEKAGTQNYSLVITDLHMPG